MSRARRLPITTPGGWLLTLLVGLLAGAGLFWARRRRWTRHEVSDPGVTL